MVTFHVSLQIGVLSESFSTLGARESVFVLVREMNHLVFLQSVFPPESFSTEATFVRGLASVGHHMLPELVGTVVLHRTVGAMEPCDAKMSIINVGSQMRIARELSSTFLALEWFFTSVNHLVDFQSRV